MRTCNCKPQSPRRALLGVIVPTAIIALMPKCPLCLVAYAASLGVGLSVPFASSLRVALLLASVVLLVVFVLRRISRPRSREKIGSSD